MKRLCSWILAAVIAVSAVLLPTAAAGLLFQDVKRGSYYYNSVSWAVEQGITEGTSATTFSPDADCTRGQAVTFLWRFYGSPSPETALCPFTDIDPESYCYDAVLWSVEQGIAKGTSEGIFSPDEPCTRAQIVTFLHRAKGSPAAASGGNPFRDVAANSWFHDSVLWAVGENITTGTTQTTFSPDALCTRGQIVTFLFRTTDAYTPVSFEPVPVHVYSEGIRITDVFLHNDVIYAGAADFITSLKGSVSDDGTCSISIAGHTFAISPDQAGIVVDGSSKELTSPVVTYNAKAYIPLEELCKLMQISVYRDPDYGTVYCTKAAFPGTIEAGHNVPTLMYHAVSNDLWGIKELFVKPERMEEQLKYLTEHGYDPIFFSDLYHLEDYDKPVLLTFDDGYEDNYTELFPLLKKYNVKATVFIITGSVGGEHYLKAEQIKEMADSGLVSIQSHTESHPDLDTVSSAKQQEEMALSKARIARLTRREAYVLCYPTGKYNSDTLSAIDEYYDFGIKMNGGLYRTGSDPYRISRYYISRNTTLSEFSSLVSDAS